MVRVEELPPGAPRPPAKLPQSKSSGRPPMRSYCLPLRTELVVLGALFGVGQHRVRLVDFLEFLLRVSCRPDSCRDGIAGRACETPFLSLFRWRPGERRASYSSRERPSFLLQVDGTRSASPPEVAARAFAARQVRQPQPHECRLVGPPISADYARDGRLLSRGLARQVAADRRSDALRQAGPMLTITRAGRTSRFLSAVST